MTEGAWPWEQVGPGLPQEHVGPGLPREEAETAAAPSSPAAGVAGCINSPCTNRPHTLATILLTSVTITKLLKFLEVRVHTCRKRTDKVVNAYGFVDTFQRNTVEKHFTIGFLAKFN
jgi:hypothetical protein